MSSYASLCETLAKVGPTQAVPALTTILHRLFAQGGAQGVGDLHEWFLVAECLLATVFPVFPQGAPRSAELSMPMRLVQQQQVDVLHRQARKSGSQEGVEVEATLEAAQALLAAAFSLEHPLSAAPLARPGAPPLTPVQRVALSTLVNEDLLWSDGLQLYAVWDRETLFTGYGLPDSRNTLRHLLALRGASPTEPLAPTLTQLQYWVVGKLEAFDFLWASEQDFRLRLEQLLMSYGLPPSQAALHDLLLG